jgi:DNA-binding response OmpR family regulator
MNRHALLIVDDEPDVVQGLKEKLADDQYEVKTAHDGQEALAILENEQIELMILDVQMSNLNGLGVLTELQKRGMWLPVIVLSDTGQEERGSEINDFGIIDFLKKPILPKRVAATVDEVMRNRERADLIKNFGLSSMLQLIEMEKRTGILMLNIGKECGRIFFKNGRLMDIQVKGLSTEEALEECIDSLDEDREICIEYIKHQKENKINMSLMEMVMEASRRKDEKDNHVKNGEPDSPNFLSVVRGRLDSLKEVENYIIADAEGEVLTASSKDYDEAVLNAGIYLWAIGETIRHELHSGQPIDLECHCNARKRLIFKHNDFIFILDLMAITRISAFKKKLKGLFFDLNSKEEAAR